MDLSKLPKLSQTPPPPEPPKEEPADITPHPAGRGIFCQSCGSAVPAGQRFCGVCGADTLARAGAPQEGASNTAVAVVQAWFFLIVGVLMMIYGGNYARYTVAHLRHQPYHTGVTWVEGSEKSGEVEYPDIDGHPLWSDSAIFFFGLALILAGIAELLSAIRLRIARGVIALSLVTILAATLYNLYVSGQFLKVGIIPLITGLFTAFGGYIVYEQWALLQTTRTRAIN